MISTYSLIRVIAPDQRGYGQTTGWDASYDGDLMSFRTLNLVRDELGLLAALGISEVAAVVGHDAGASVAGWSALVRPDIFRSAVMMSAPFAGPSTLPAGTADHPAPPSTPDSLHQDLAALDLDPQDRTPGGGFYVDDLISGESWEWAEYNYVRLDPHVEPAHILSVRRNHQ